MLKRRKRIARLSTFQKYSALVSGAVVAGPGSDAGAVRKGFEGVDDRRPAVVATEL